MLQICTGRFFGGGERFKADGEKILASVVELREPVVTPAGIIEPGGPGPGPGVHLAKFTFQYGLKKPPPDQMIGTITAAGEREIVQQMRVLLQVATARIWEDDPCRLADLVRRQDRSQGERHEPHPIPKFLSPAVIEEAEVSRFLGGVLSIRRALYEKVVAAATALDTAARVSEDVGARFAEEAAELAATLAVFSIESLVPEGEPPELWEHLHWTARKPVDTVLKRQDAEIVAAIRRVILDKRYYGVTAAFNAFVTSTVGARASFFRNGTIRRSDFPRLVKNAYSTRSSFAHRLKGDGRKLRGPYSFGHAENGDVYLTLWGSILLAIEVIRSVVESAEHLDAEAGVPWDVDLPGTSRFRWAPSEVLWMSGAFNAQLRHRFSDLVVYLEEGRPTEARPNVSVNSLAPVLSSRARVFDTLSDDDRRLLMVILQWWDHSVAPDARVPETSGILEASGHLLRELTVETLALHAFLGCEFPWEMADVEEAWNAYEREDRYKEGRPALPHAVESVVRAAVANRYLAAGNRDDFLRWCHRLADDEGWRPEVRDHALVSAENGTPVDVGMAYLHRPRPV